MVQEDDAVGDVFLEALARERVDAALAGDDRGDAALLQPGEQPPQLGAQHAGVAQSGEQRFDRVEHDAARADRAQRVIEADEEAFEVVFPGLFDLRALDPDVFDRQPLALDEIGDVVAERRDVLDDVLFGLFERHEDAALAAGGAVDQELERRTGSCRTRARRTPASAGLRAARHR